ncbi:MAG: alpha/beta hydrolase family protein [Spirochaetia bacterium]
MKKAITFFLILLSITLGSFASGAQEENTAGDQEESTVPETTLEGTWEGAISVQGQQLGIILRLTKKDTAYAGTIDIPQQNAYSIPLTDISLEDNSVRFILPSNPAQAVFQGKAAGDELSGSFNQGGASGTFSAARVSDSGEIKQPEVPGKEEDVELPVEGGTLKGTLLIPEGNPPFPGVLIIPGSGPTDRNGNSAIAGRNDSLLKLAYGLAEKGYASLRIDKRGVGESVWPGMTEEDLTLDIYVEDTGRWLSFLQNLDQITGTAVAGHSEGALVGAVTVRKSDTRALVSIAGMGESFGETIKRQLSPYPEEVRKEAARIINSLEQGKTVSDISESQIIQSLFRPSVQPYMISILKYDPAEVVADIDVPVLIVQGTQDLQVTMAAAEKLAKAGKNAELKVIEDMNHVLKEVENLEENQASYSDPSFPLADGLITVISGFLADVIK